MFLQYYPLHFAQVISNEMQVSIIKFKINVQVSVSLGDMKGVDAWEERLRARGTPLTTFYNSWHKVHQRQQAKRATDNDKVSK